MIEIDIHTPNTFLMNICCMKFINSLLFIYQVNIKCNDNNIMFTCDTYNSNDVYNKKHLIAQKI